MAQRRRMSRAEQARLLGRLFSGEPGGHEPGGHELGGHELDDDEFGDDDDEESCFDEDEDDWRPRPEWLHPGCLNVCTALELGTCCKYPDNPLVRVAVDLAASVDRALGGFGNGECAAAATGLARLFRSVPGLLAQVHAILPRLNATAVAQLMCPVGRLAGALDQACGYGCPWACHDPAVPDQRAEFEFLRPLLAECLNGIRAALGWPAL